MSDEEKKNQSGLVSSGNRGLATRSSGLARRGLELLSSQQVRTIYFPTDRSIGKIIVYKTDSDKPKVPTNTGPTDLKDLITVGGFYIEGGIREFSTWSKIMLQELGEAWEPFFRIVFRDAAKILNIPVEDTPVEKEFNALGKILVPIEKNLGFLAASEEELLNYALGKEEKPKPTITDSDLLFLQEIYNLRALDLSLTNIIGNGLSYLRGLNILTRLNLSETMLTDDGLSHLPELPELEQLDLSKTKITGSSLTHLRKLSKLKCLDLSNTELTDAGLSHLPELPDLEYLSLSDTKITNSGLIHLQRLTKLNILKLSNIQLTDAGLIHLQQIPKLESLDLSQTKITDDGLVQLSGLVRLRKLYFIGTQISDSGLIHIQGLTNLNILWLSNTAITDAGLSYLRNSINL